MSGRDHQRGASTSGTGAKLMIWTGLNSAEEGKGRFRSLLKILLDRMIYTAYIYAVGWASRFGIRTQVNHGENQVRTATLVRPIWGMSLWQKGGRVIVPQIGA